MGVGRIMLEFAVVVMLCSTWPPSQDQCIIAVEYELQFDKKEHCILFARHIANLVPIDLTYPMKGWGCLISGEVS